MKYFILILFTLSTFRLNGQINVLSVCECKVYAYNESAKDYTSFKKNNQDYNIELNILYKTLKIETTEGGFTYKINSERDRSKYSDDYQYFYPTVTDFEGKTCQILFIKLDDFWKDEKQHGATLIIFYPLKSKIEYSCNKSISLMK